MPLRKILIQIMLWSLAATAVLGAMTAVMGTTETGWRFVGTGIIFAIAAAFMMPFSLRAEKPDTRLDGLAGMILIIILLVGSLASIWQVFSPLGRETESAIGLSTTFLAICGLPAVGFMRLWLMPGHRIAGHTGVIVALAAFVLLLLSAWTGNRFGPDEEWAAVGGIVGTLGVLGTFALLSFDKVRPWRWIGVLASVAGIGVASYAVWGDLRNDEDVLAVIVSIAAVVAHASVCLVVPLTAGQRWVPLPTILAGIATALFADIYICTNEDLEMAGKLASATGIICGCGTLALVVLAKLNKQVDRPPTFSDFKALTVICPGCETKQELSVGDSACITCGLKFSIKLEEPRCPQCDYLLYKLQSPRCPECGFEPQNPPSVTPIPVQPV